MKFPIVPIGDVKKTQPLPSVNRFRLSACALFALALSLAGCIIGGKDGNPEGSEVENEILGSTLFLANGDPAVNAAVRVYPVDHNPQAAAPKTTAAKAVVFSTRTDSKGRYDIDSLPRGEYNILSELDGEMAYQDSVFIAGTKGEIASDTLRDPGSLSGRVVLQPNHPPRTATVQILGTNTFVNVDEAGGFALEGLAEGRYRARVVTTLDEYTPTFADIHVRSGESDTLAEPIRLIYTGIPVVRNLRVSYDTLAGVARIEWDRVSYSDLSEYLVFRNPLSSPVPAMVPIARASDTFYLDTLYRGISEAEVAVGADFEYRVAVRNRSDESGKSHGFVVAHAAAPAAVATFQDLKSLKTIAGEASINDTVGFALEYRNRTRKISRISWFLDGAETPLRIQSASGGSGNDTLWLPIGGTVAIRSIRTEVEDDAGDIWTRTERVSVIRDAPVVFPSEAKSRVVLTGDTIRIRGQDEDAFGRILKWEWDLGGQGVFSGSSGPDTLFIPRQIGRTYCVLRVTDDDGNSPQDTLWFEVVEKPEFALIPAGTFVNLKGETVSVGPFRIMTKEVTRAQFIYYMGRENSNFTGDPALPAESMGLFEAVRFCIALSRIAGLPAPYYDHNHSVEVRNQDRAYRLPTGDEWEYAARSGSMGPYWQDTHPDSLDQDTWYAGNSGGTTHPVGSKRPNGFGLYDMNGNVSEYAHPRIPEGTALPVTVFGKGSNWSSDYAGTNLAADFSADANAFPNKFTGFRVVLPGE